MRITQKMAKEYVADPNRWYLIQDGEYAKVYRLDFGSKSYLKVCIKEVLNSVAEFMGGEVEVRFADIIHYEYKVKYDCFGYSISESRIAEEIWKEAKTII